MPEFAAPGDVLQLTVRSACADDEAAIVALWQGSGLVVSYNDPSVDFRFALARPNSDILAGWSEAGHIVGSVMVGHDGHRGWLYYLAASPRHRSEAIGRRMVRAAEEWLRNRGVRKVQLMVRQSNTGVIGFYEKLGYEETPRVILAKWLCEPAAALTEPDPEGRTAPSPRDPERPR